MSSNNHQNVRAGTYSSILELKWIDKLCIGSGHFVNDITASIWFSYYLMYAQEVLGFSPNLAATLMLLGQIVDGICTPLVGYEADKGQGQKAYWLCHSGFGRYKSWHLLGVFMSLCSFPFIFSPPIGGNSSSELAKAIYYIPFIIIYEASWASVQISHLALIPKMNPDLLIRTEILAIRYILMVVANVTVFLVTWTSLGLGKKCKIDTSDVATFQHLSYIAMGIGLVTALIFYVTTKEHSDERVKEALEDLKAVQNTSSSRFNERSPLLLNSNENNESIRDEFSSGARSEGADLPESGRCTVPNPLFIKRSLGTQYLNPGKETMTVWDWVKLPQFYMVGAVYITGRLVINVPQAYLPLYLQKTLHLSCGSIATIPMTYFLSGFAVATVMKIMNKHIGRQFTFAFGIILNLSGAGIILWGDWSVGSFLRETGVYGVFALLGGGASAGMITGLSITADMIGNNIESGAFVYGFMSFCDKFSCGITIMIINLLSPNMEPGHSSPEIESFYTYVMVFSCVGCSILAILGLTALTIYIYINNRNIERRLNN